VHYDDVNKLAYHQQTHYYVIYADNLLHIAYISRHFTRLQGADTNISLKHTAMKYIIIDLYMLWYQYTPRSDVIQF